MREKMFKIRILALLIASSTLTDEALADEKIQYGKEIAEQYCVECHDISPEGAFKTYPPSFASIAAFRSENDIRGRIKFQPIHTGMPRFAYILMPDEFEPLVAFMLSLEYGSE